MTVTPKSQEPGERSALETDIQKWYLTAREDKVSRKRVTQKGKEPGLSSRALQHLESEDKASQGEREGRRHTSYIWPG